MGGEHDGYAHRWGRPIHRRVVLHWAIDPHHAVLWISDRVNGDHVGGTSTLPLDASLSVNRSGTITGVASGSLLGFGFVDISMVEGRVTQCMGRWRPATQVRGRFLGGAPQGWVIAIGDGLSLSVDEQVLVHIDGARVGRFPRPDRVETPDLIGR